MGRKKLKGRVGLVRRCTSPLLRLVVAIWRPTLHLAIAGSLLSPLAGCTRSFYRKAADKEVSEVLANKDKYEAWKIENWHVYPDPRARFAMVGSIDRPPMPPDDPAAFELSPNPQKPGKAGIERQEGSGYLTLMAMWDQQNRTRKAEEAAEERKKQEGEEPPSETDPARAPLGGESKVGPSTEQQAAGGKESGPGTGDTRVGDYAPREAIAEAKARSLIDFSGRPVFLLTLEQAAELAMFNSREFQDQRENLYLAALPVTQERFAFSSQFFALADAFRTVSGSKTAEGKTNSWTTNNATGFAKILPTGALLLLNFSNQTVFNFVNPKGLTSVTSLDFSALQPLLQGSGFAFTLESLTQSERNLLYQIRSFARFRKQLFVEVASNSGGSISGGTFQPTGVLSNTGGGGTGLGSTGLIPGLPVAASAVLTGNLVNYVTPNSPGSLYLNNAITPPPSGYLNTMLEKLQVYIDQENIDTLTSILQRFRGLLEGDVVGPLQVQSVEQRLLAGRTTLLSDQQQYMLALDSFKIALGIPMRLFIEMDDSPLQPLIKQYRLARSIIENEQAAVSTAGALIDQPDGSKVRPELKRLYQKSAIVRGTKFAETIISRWGTWEKLSKEELGSKLDDLKKESQKLLDQQADLQKEGKKLTSEENQKLLQVNNDRDLGTLESYLRLYETNYSDSSKTKNASPAERRQRIRTFQGLVSSWQKILVQARDEQWNKVRRSWPELPPCCLQGVDLVNSELATAQAVASQYALEHRFDLMNVRGQVMDSWRQLAIYANSLLGLFNVGYKLSATSPLGGAQPLNIGGSATTNQLSLNTQLPLVRIQQRNNYRASVIAYTRQRRALQEAEDLTVQAVWGEIYNLRLFAEQYKVQKRQLELAYLTIDASLESLQQPTAPPALPGVTGARGGSDGPAALTTQLLNAQATLPAAQNTLLQIWINYLNARLQLYRDLELMPLDQRNVWIDRIKECECEMRADEPKDGENKSGDEMNPTKESNPKTDPQSGKETKGDGANKGTPGTSGKPGDSSKAPELLKLPKLSPGDESK